MRVVEVGVSIHSGCSGVTPVSVIISGNIQGIELLCIEPGFPHKPVLQSVLLSLTCFLFVYLLVCFVSILFLNNSFFFHFRSYLAVFGGITETPAYSASAPINFEVGDTLMKHRRKLVER